jgi:single-strand DNA-binding protein
VASFNKVILVGNLTRDPELGYTKDSKAYAKFGLAVNEGENYTLFIDCTAWNKTAELIDQYVKKGSPVLIEGRLKLESWEKDGQKRSKHSVSVDRIQFLASRSQQEETSTAEPASVSADNGPTVPF